MISTYRRALDQSDLDELRKSRGSLLRNIPLALLSSVVVFGIVFLISKSWMVAGLLSVVLFLASLVSNLRFFGGLRRGVKNAQAVEVIDVQADGAVEIEHLGSHGPAYCFFVGDGQTLLVVGQWLLECERFPAASFRICRWSDSGKPIRIEVTGSAIAATHSSVRLSSSHRFKDIEIFRAGRESLQRDIDAAFTPAK